MAIDTDITGYRVWRSETPNFVKDDSTLCYDGPDTYITLNVPSTNTWYYAVAAYDAFGKTGLNISGEQFSTPLSINAITWDLSGIVFSIDSVIPNKIVWTGGTIIRNGITSYTIEPGSAVWSTGYLYIYFNPVESLTQLRVTTVLGVAVTQEAYPIATYTGGGADNIKGGTGSAFISGSQIIAGTVGASQLIAGSAVITGAAQIANAIITTEKVADSAITNLKIGNEIKSLDFDANAHTGWRIQKNGKIMTYGSLAIFDGNGTAILTSGGSFDGTYIKQASIDTASIKALAVKEGKIDDLAVTRAKIDDLAVNSLKIQGDSVTIPRGANAGAGGSASITMNTQFTDVGNVVVAAPVCVIGTLLAYHPTLSPVVQLWYRNSSNVATLQAQVNVTPGVFSSVALSKVITPSTGNCAYYITCTDTSHIISSSILAVGCKR